MGKMLVWLLFIIFSTIAITIYFGNKGATSLSDVLLIFKMEDIVGWMVSFYIIVILLFVVLSGAFALFTSKKIHDPGLSKDV